MKIEYVFIENEKLLIQKAFGEWNTNYYKKYSKEVFQNPKILQVKKILTDLRDANLEKAFKDIEIMLKLRDSMVNLNYLNVCLVNNPSNTAVTQLYQHNLAEKGFLNRNNVVL